MTWPASPRWFTPCATATATVCPAGCISTAATGPCSSTDRRCATATTPAACAPQRRGVCHYHNVFFDHASIEDIRVHGIRDLDASNT